MKIAQLLETRGDILKLKVGEKQLSKKAAEVFNVNDVDFTGEIAVVRRLEISFASNPELREAITTTQGRFTLLNGEVVRIK